MAVVRYLYTYLLFYSDHFGYCYFVNKHIFHCIQQFVPISTYCLPIWQLVPSNRKEWWTLCVRVLWEKVSNLYRSSSFVRGLYNIGCYLPVYIPLLAGHIIPHTLGTQFTTHSRDTVYHILYGHTMPHTLGTQYTTYSRDTVYHILYGHSMPHTLGTQYTTYSRDTVYHIL